MKLKFGEGLINTLSFGAACLALTSPAGGVAVTGGLLSVAASGGGLINCVGKSKQAEFKRFIKVAQKSMEHDLRLDARVKDEFTQADIDDTFAALQAGFTTFKGDTLLADFARWNLDPEKVSFGLIEKLSNSEISPYLAGSEPGRYIAQLVIKSAFRALKTEEVFWKNVDIYVQEEVLNRLEGLKAQNTSEADRVIETLTERFNLSGEQKINFDSAIRHILEGRDERDATAREVLKSGHLQAALDIRYPRLRQESAHINDVNKAHAQDWRDSGALAFPVNVLKAIEAYENAIKYDGDDFWDYVYLSRLQCGRDLVIARRTILDGQPKTTNERDLSVYYSQLGNIAVAQGDLPGARAAYEASLEIFESLAGRDPENTGWQRDLAVSYVRLGGLALNEDADANKLWLAAYDIMQRLNDEDKMLPTDQDILDFLKVKVEGFKDK